ncbi:MAG: DNA packaging protein, partial [Clostridiales bacterium]|nr:DNA packaging protein [Clostridiales bacterium]
MSKKKLTTAQKLKIINSDPVLWLSNFVKIIDNEGKEVPFKVNKEQLDFVENMDKFNIILKGRQIGFTTLALGLMLYYAHQNKNTNYMLISYDTDSVNNIFNKLKLMYESIPDKYRVKSKRDNRNELVLENGSRISVKIASHKSLGRSFTCQFIHISEMAFFQDGAGKDVLVGLEQSLAKNTQSRIVIESTANGVGNAYYDLYQNANKGRSKYKGFFYHWFADGAKNQFKHELDLAEHWYKSENKGVRLNPKELTPYEKNLYDKGCTLKQLMWRQWKLQDMSEEAFRQEFPSTVEEAFISTDIGVFDSEVILERYNYLPKPITS